MFKDLKDILNQQGKLVSQYSIDTDKAFNRYIVLGNAASLTLIINLISKSPDILKHNQYMDWALYCFAFSLILSGVCLFFNARLADVSIYQNAKLKGFLVGYQTDSTVDEEAIKALNDIASEKKLLLKIGRRIIIFLELFSGLLFGIGVLIAVVEVSRVL